jgi:hypothetical protein
MDDIKVEVGYQSVTIQKMFGPQIFADLRITADPKNNMWVIEREIIKTGEWVEWARIPGQVSFEFDDEEDV